MRSWLWGVLCGCLCAGHAGAATFCVGDADGLATALANAGSNNQDNDILVQQGTYALKDAFFYDGNNGHALHVLGGYTVGCSTAGRTLAPANTVLDGSALSPPLQLLFNARGGDVLIEGLRWTKFAVGAGGGAAIHLQQLDGIERGRLIFRFNEVDHNASPLAAVELSAYNEVELSTNLAHDNTAPDALLVDAPYLPRGARIVHNTVTANTGIGLHVSSQWTGLPVALYNNILYGNSVASLRVSTQPVLAFNNTVGSFASDVGPNPYVSGSSGNTSTNPNLSPATFAPLPGSPAINSGIPFADVLPAQDIAGIKRTYGSAPDRGAFEAVYGDLSVFQVTNTHDSGAGSLRDAIHQANLAGTPSLIQFQIGSSCGPGGGPQIITLLTALENIKAPVIVDGYTQPGAAPNTLAKGFDAKICIMLSGGGQVGTAFQIAKGTGGARLDVSGIAFTWFTNYAIVLADGKGHHVHGNTFGVGTANTGPMPGNGANLILNGNAHAATIGGTPPAERNLFGSAGFFGNGLNLSSVDSYSVTRNNYIGTDAAGMVASANSGSGIQIYASQHNLVADNLISGNDSAGIELVGNSSSAASLNTVQNNTIGKNANGAALGNGFSGIWVSSYAQSNMLGASSIDDLHGGNAIGGNTGPGVYVDSSAGSNNYVFANAIDTNTGLAIDLDTQGPLANDALDADSGPNGLQNTPVITRAVRISPYLMHVEGTVASKPTTAYYVSLYASSSCDASGYGPAQIPIGTFISTIADANGNVSFSTDIGNSLSGMPTTGVVTATASTVTDGTSEISACHAYLDDHIFYDGFELPAPPSKF